MEKRLLAVHFQLRQLPSVAKVDAYDESSTGYDKDYTRVHRDPAIVKAMREWVGL